MSDEDIQRIRAAAQAILGARAAERMDAKRSREHFRCRDETCRAKSSSA